MTTNFPHYYPGWELIGVRRGAFLFERREFIGEDEAVSCKGIHRHDLEFARERLSLADREFQAFIDHERSK